VVADARTGEVLASHAADEGFTPASNTKLLTAAVALETLGPDHRLVTELLQTGEVRDGGLHGELVLRGGGDPTLGTEASGDPDLTAFVDAVRAAGIRSAEAVAGDGSWLGDEHFGRGWEWDDLGEAYAAPFGGLCCRGNLCGEPVRPGWCTAPERQDPALYAAMCVAQALRDGGVDVAATRAGTTEGTSGSVLHAHRSPPVARLVRTVLCDSDNLFAEQLWRVSARTATGDGGSAAAERHAKMVLSELGVDVHGLAQADGSGLSRHNLLRPSHLASLLVAMRASKCREAWLDALPVAGESGTLRGRFVDGPARGCVRAKTGSMDRVRCLSGYVLCPDSPPLVFTVLWNDFTGSDGSVLAAIDAFVQRLARLR
jgi:D-alanyl-D-alanine carboxypeptidase/D-alanyl-D-alanine-endopeptidase (penicillin-binding protein 4)